MSLPVVPRLLDAVDWPGATFMRLDLFPALIAPQEGYTLPGDPSTGVWDARRVLITDSYVFVLSDSNHGPQLTYAGTLVDYQPSNNGVWEIQTEDLNLRIRRSKGCGCGSRLRGTHVYSGIPYMPG